MKNTAQAAEILGVSPGRVRQRCESGDIKAEKVGRDWIMEDAEVERAKSSTRGRGRPRTIADASMLSASELARATHDWIPRSKDADGTPYVAPAILLGYTEGGRARVELWRMDGKTEVRYVDAEHLRPRE